MPRPFRVPAPGGVLAVLTADAALLYAAYIAGLYIALGAVAPIVLWFEGGFGCITLVIAGFVLAMYYQDMYTQFAMRSGTLLTVLASSAGAAFIICGVAAYVSAGLRLPFSVMLCGGAISVSALFVWRTICGRCISGPGELQSLLFLGTDATVNEIAARLRDTGGAGFRIAGYLGHEDSGTVSAVGACLGPLDRIGEVARSLLPDRIIVAMTGRRSRLPVTQLLDLRFEGFAIDEAAALYETVCGRVAVTTQPLSTLVFSDDLGPRRTRVLWHSATSFGVALIATILLSPLMLAIAVAIKLTSAGPVLSREPRMGLNGELFDMLRFRTARESPLRSRDREGAELNSRTCSPAPAMTFPGRFLHKTRLDALPQLLNVLRIEMAIVGPRPERPETAKAYSQEIPFYRLRHSILPGMTGWAQVNHSPSDGVANAAVELEYDLYYIKYLSLGLDLHVLWHTLTSAVISGRQSA